MEIKTIHLLLLLLLAMGGAQAQSFTQREVLLPIVKEPQHDTMQLAGTLTLPNGATEKVPAVILITGSGAQNRDEELMGHRPFKVIAEYLSVHGYAVLRCDDRGVGGSTGDMAHATAFDFASDVEHQVEYLQSQASGLNIDPERIYLLGHSEGATVAAIVAASRAPSPHPVAGVAMLGGAGVDGKTILLQQNETLFRLRGLPDTLVQRRLACMRDIFATLDTLTLGSQADTLKTINLALRPLFRQHSQGLNKEQKQQAGLTIAECYGWAMTAASPWMRTFLALNPADHIAQMRCPLLAIGGEKDSQVDAKQNLKAIADACRRNNIPHDTVLLAGINHLGQKCTTGSVDEYATLGQAPDRQVLDVLLRWLDSKSRPQTRRDAD